MKKIIKFIFLFSLAFLPINSTFATEVLSDPYISESACKAILYKNNEKYPDYDRSGCFQQFGNYYYKICEKGTSCGGKNTSFIKSDNLNSVNNYIDEIVNPEQEEQIKEESSQKNIGATENNSTNLNCNSGIIKGYTYPAIKNRKSDYGVREIFAGLQYHRVDCKNWKTRLWQFYDKNNSSVTYLKCYHGYNPSNFSCQKQQKTSVLNTCSHWQIGKYSYAGFSQWEIQTAYFDVFGGSKQTKISCDSQWNVTEYKNKEFITSYLKCNDGFAFHSGKCRENK